MQDKYYSIGISLIKNLPLTLNGALISNWRKGQKFSTKDACFSLELPIQGKFIFKTEQGRKILDSNHVFIGHSGKEKYMEAAVDDSRKISLSVSGANLQQILNSCSLLDVEVVNLSEAQYIQRLFFKAVEIIEKTDQSNDFYQLNASSIAYRILIGISSHLQMEKYPPALKNAVSYCENNLDKSISLNSLAAQCNTTGATLIRLFKKHLSTTPIRYLNEMRMQCAATLLKNSHLQIKDIAYRCGYNDPYNFSNEFKKYYNLSPRNYRNREHGSIDQTICAT